MILRRPKVRGVVAAALVVAVLGACGGGGGGSPTELTVTDAWARATPTAATNGAVYLTVTSPDDDQIVGVGVPARVAADAQMHSAMSGDDGGAMGNMPGMDHGEEGGMAEMVPLEQVDLPAGEAVAFEPGQRHIMLTGLADGLQDGEEFTLTLRFRHAPERRVPVTVSTQAP